LHALINNSTDLDPFIHTRACDLQTCFTYFWITWNRL